MPLDNDDLLDWIYDEAKEMFPFPDRDLIFVNEYEYWQLMAVSTKNRADYIENSIKDTFLTMN